MKGHVTDQQTLLSQALKHRAAGEGFNPVGIARIPGSPRLQLRTQALQRWLDHGHQADMAWMAAPRRRDPRLLLDGANSVLAVGLNYYVDAQPSPGCLKVARYGWGRDYHRVVDQRLRRIGRWLSEQRPDCGWRACVDATPLLDKAWAEEAGLGWIGKNGNLISPSHGSWLLLGHLLTTARLPADQPARSLCGHCQRCLPACPTAAITEPFVVDSRRCIAFHTIENRDEQVPLPLHGWVAGCDVCQEVCPWNQHHAQSSADPAVQPREWILSSTANEMASWSDDTWSERLQASALRRIKPWMWRRNLADLG